MTREKSIQEDGQEDREKEVFIMPEKIKETTIKKQKVKPAEGNKTAKKNAPKKDGRIDKSTEQIKPQQTEQPAEETTERPKYEMKIDRLGRPNKGWGGAHEMSPVVGDNGVQGVTRDEISKYVDFARQVVLRRSPVERRDIAGMRQQLEDYIDLCVEKGVKPGNLACYAAIGIDKQIAYDWMHNRNGIQEQFDFIRLVQGVCAVSRECLGSDRQISAELVKFWQKNYDGLKDESSFVVAPANPLDDTSSAEELATKYLTSAPEE